MVVLTFPKKITLEPPSILGFGHFEGSHQQKYHLSGFNTVLRYKLPQPIVATQQTLIK